MVYAFVVALVAAIVLAYALYTQNKASAKQAEEQQRLLDDYQQRVNEQQKLLEDYRALEKNFDNVGEGYEQALLAFDKMNEEQDKARVPLMKPCRIPSSSCRRPTTCCSRTLRRRLRP